MESKSIINLQKGDYTTKKTSDKARNAIANKLGVDQQSLCPICNGILEEKECLVNRTTSPEEDDRFENLLVCTKCDHFEPINNSVDEIDE